MTGTWLQVAQEAIKIPALIVEIYGDLARPGVQQVGKALGTVLGLGNTVLWPIYWANERSRMYLERNLEDYRQRLQHVPEEKIVAVVPEIGVPIADRLNFARDPKLADMYVSLLAKASNIDTISEAHPSFVNIINNLSPDEAQLLEYFATFSDLMFVNADWVGATIYSVAGDLLIDAEQAEKLAYPKNSAAYASNLVGLGLISVHRDRTLHDSDERYAATEKYWLAKVEPATPPEPGRVLRFKRGTLTVTPFGNQFISACHSPQQS